MQQFGHVHVYGTDWEAFDYKSATKECVCFHSVLKWGKRWADLKPELLPKRTSVKAAKKRDVLALLGAIGVSDVVRAFYDDALYQVTDNDEDAE